MRVLLQPTRRTALSLHVYMQPLQRCSTSTETVRSVKDGVAQDGHLDFHTAPELCVHHLPSVEVLYK